MKNYIYKGKQFQFDEKDVPAGAIPVDEYAKKAASRKSADHKEVESEAVEKKAAEVSNNKARTPKGNKSK